MGTDQFASDEIRCPYCSKRIKLFAFGKDWGARAPRMKTIFAFIFLGIASLLSMAAMGFTYIGQAFIEED